jgi:hypothetical protein
VVSRRQAAWGESMRDAGAAVEVVEAGVLGMRGNLTEGAARSGWVQLPGRSCFSAPHQLIWF